MGFRGSKVQILSSRPESKRNRAVTTYGDCPFFVGQPEVNIFGLAGMTNSVYPGAPGSQDLAWIDLTWSEQMHPLRV